VSFDSEEMSYVLKKIIGAMKNEEKNFVELSFDTIKENDT
jgi:hypothetical protein